MRMWLLPIPNSGRCCATGGSGIVSSAPDVLGMSVVRGRKGVMYVFGSGRCRR